MFELSRLWCRLPVVVRAVLAGVIVAAIGTEVWARLISANLAHRSEIPWSVPIMGGYLALYWCWFVRGWGWPRATREARRRAARANSVSDYSWGTAILAGILGLVSILLLQAVMSRLVRLPAQRDIDPSQFPVLTVFLWVVTSAMVAGVVEETAFRGYLQRPIERRHGPVVAILITGALFGLAHFRHPEVGLVLMPYYMAVAAVYGSLAYLTDSTLPSMTLHAGGNILSAFDLFTRGRSEWQATATPAPLIWETGVDAAFVGAVVALLAMSVLTVWAFRGLARIARADRGWMSESLGTNADTE